MKELKFRAWKMHNGKLRRYVCSPFELLNYAQRHPEAPVLHYQDVNDIRDFMPDVDVIEQYTGLKDKNGKEIYEGDIVKYSYKMDTRDKRLLYSSEVVEFDTIEEEEWPNSTISGFILHSSEDGYEVIGNVHENPELLSKEEE